MMKREPKPFKDLLSWCTWREEQPLAEEDALLVKEIRDLVSRIGTYKGEAERWRWVPEILAGQKFDNPVHAKQFFEDELVGYRREIERLKGRELALNEGLDLLGKNLADARALVEQRTREVELTYKVQMDLRALIGEMRGKTKEIAAQDYCNDCQKIAREILALTPEAAGERMRGLVEALEWLSEEGALIAGPADVGHTERPVTVKDLQDFARKELAAYRAGK